MTADYIPASDKRPAANVPVPVLPDAAKEFSKEGLEEFTRYWYSTLGYAFETGDTGPMLAITDPGCQTCQAMNEAVVDGHADGSWIEGGQMNVLFTQGNMHQAPDGTYQTIATVMQQNVKYYGPDKVLIEDMGINKAVDDIVISNYVNGHWTAKTVEHLMGSEGE